MKTEATAFGFEVLVTFLLPGLLVLFGIGLYIDWPPCALNDLLKFAKEAQFLATFALLGAIALLGTIVASLQAVLESLLLDRLTPKLMGISPVIFYDDWDKYIVNLKAYKNSYVSRVVLYFQFETRLGLSLVFCGTAIFSWSWEIGLLVIAIGLAFYGIGAFHHKELGHYRHNLFKDA